MKILITGANGFLGQHLCRSLASKGFEVVGASRGDCRITNLKGIKYQSVDVTKKEAVIELLALEKPNVIIHNAAMSKPDICKSHPQECLLQNVEATNYLLQSCKNFTTFFVYISSDFVLGDGGPHDETIIPNPLNFYGETKLKAEYLVQTSGLQFAIVRPVFIYGKIMQAMQPTFLHWVKNNLENNNTIKVVNDQFRTPTFVNDICDGIYLIIDKFVTGIFHLAGKDILTPYDMAVKLAHLLQLDATLIKPVNSESFADSIIRAKQSGLKIDKAMAVLSYNPVSFDEGLRLSFQ